jgi:adenine deaminase
MVCALKRIDELKGGIVVAHRGKIIAELALLIGGYIADCPIEEAAKKTDANRRSTEKTGCRLSNPVFCYR